MTLENEKFRVTIEEDPCYTIDSADNKPYDVVWNPMGLKKRDYSRAIAVEVWWEECWEEHSYRGLLLTIDPLYHFWGEDWAVLTKDRLTVLWDKGLIQLDLSSRELMFCKSLIDLGCARAILPCPEGVGGYVIYNELDVLKLDSDFGVEWRSADMEPLHADAFVSIAMTEERILLDDWEGNRYELDYQGNILLSRPGTLFSGDSI